MHIRVMFRICLLLLIAGIGLNCSNSGSDQDERKAEFVGRGIVLSLDKENAVVTLDHEEVKGLMSAMTMDFQVANKSLLNGLENGDIVEFTLLKTGGDLKLTSIKKTGKQIASGAKIFKQGCAKCHGDKGEGRKKGIPLIEGHALSHPEEDFLKQVREGGKKMPAFSDKLSEKEIAAVVKFVREEIQKGLREDSGHEH